jgi:two-component system, sensor histidine kinase and response regulator
MEKQPAYIAALIKAMIGIVFLFSFISCDDKKNKRTGEEEELLSTLDSLRKININDLDEGQLSLLKDKAFAIDSKRALAFYYFIKGRTDLQKNKLDSAIYHQNLGLQLFEELNDSAFVVYSLINRSNTHRRKGSFEPAIEGFFHALDIATSTNNIDALITINGDMGLLYFEMGDYDTANNHLLSSLQLRKKEGKMQDISSLYNSMANVFKRSGQPDSALHYYQLSIEDFKTKNNDFAVGSLYSNIGLLLSEIDRMEEAALNFEYALFYMEKAGPNPNYINVLNAYSGFLIRMGRPVEALSYAIKALGMASESSSLKGQLNAYFKIAEAEEKRGAYKEAYNALNTAFDLNDSIFTETLAQSAKESELKFETAQKEKELEVSKVRIDQQKKRITYILILTGILVILTVFLIFAIIRQKRLTQTVNNQKLELIQKAVLLEKTNADLNQLNTLKTKLFSIISHDLRAPINNIKTIVELLKTESVGEVMEPEILNHLEGSVEMSTDMINKLLQWAKIQMSGFKPNFIRLSLKETVGEAIENLKEQYNQKNITLEIDIDPEIQLISDPDILRIVVYNLTQNAIKFTYIGGLIQIKGQSETDMVLLSIADNGMGMRQEVAEKLRQHKDHITTYGTANEKGAGLGLTICRELLTLSGGSFDFESTPGKGTTFNVSLPYSSHENTPFKVANLPYTRPDISTPEK